MTLPTRCLSGMWPLMPFLFYGRRWEQRRGAEPLPQAVWPGVGFPWGPRRSGHLLSLGPSIQSQACGLWHPGDSAPLNTAEPSRGTRAQPGQRCGVAAGQGDAVGLGPRVPGWRLTVIFFPRRTCPGAPGMILQDSRAGMGGVQNAGGLRQRGGVEGGGGPASEAPPPTPAHPKAPPAPFSLRRGPPSHAGNWTPARPFPAGLAARARDSGSGPSETTALT